MGLTDILNETEDDMVALEAMNISVALGVIGDIPKSVFDKAAKLGSYPKRMTEDYPN